MKIDQSCFLLDYTKVSATKLRSLKREAINFLHKNKFIYQKKHFEKAWQYLINNNRPFLTMPIVIDDKEYYIKIQVNKDNKYNILLVNEIRSYQLLGNLLNNKIEFMRLPELFKINLNSNKGYSYLIRESIKSKVFKKGHFFQDNKIDLKKIVISLKNINSYSSEKFILPKDYYINQFPSDGTLVNILDKANYYFQYQPLIFQNKVNFDKIKKIYQKAFKNPLPQPSLIHQDFNPNNILYNNKDIYLIDWEKIYLGSIWYDIACLYVYLVEKPNFQKKCLNIIIKEFGKTYVNRYYELWFMIIFQYLQIGYGGRIDPKIMSVRINKIFDLLKLGIK